MAKKQCTFYAEHTAIEKFQQKYPFLLASFIRRCIYRALHDKSFFEEIFFEHQDKY